MPSADQVAFLEDQIFGMTLAATAQRSNLYTAELTEAERKPLQTTLRAALENYSREYASSVEEGRHVENIGDLADRLSVEHSDLLESGRMRIGHAQKALNLYIKYLWCFGRAAEPPHCPIDSVILRKVPGYTQARWTQIATTEKYMEIITAAKAQAGARGLSLAEWELHAYNERDA